MYAAKLEQSQTAEPSTRSDAKAEVLFLAPTAEDGPAVHALIAACPPLDANSAYCNLLQCAHFADTCVVAKRGGALVGWLSAYRPPMEQDAIFVWQVAVSPEARGLGLGGRLIEALLKREPCRRASWLKTTITAGNEASWALFRSAASRRGASFSSAPWLISGKHLPATLPTEHLVTIGPLATRGGPDPNA